jgi:hypothetical protein
MLLWLVKGATTLCTCKKECNKYDLIVVQCFWSVRHNDLSMWFLINCCDLSLGLATKAKACKGACQEECERVWGWKLTFPSELPLGELESRWTPEPSKSDYRGQNTLHWGVFYIIGNLLKCRCLKWARMTHLDICNTIQGKKKGRESNWQFDSRPWKVGNRPDSHACRWRATHRWKSLDESYKFASNLVPIGGLSDKL